MCAKQPEHLVYENDQEWRCPFPRGYLVLSQLPSHLGGHRRLDGENFTPPLESEALGGQDAMVAVCSMGRLDRASILVMIHFCQDQHGAVLQKRDKESGKRDEKHDKNWAKAERGA